MKVLWLEDFGGLDSGVATISNLFKDFIQGDPVDYWMPEWNLSREPQRLTEFFAAADSQHTVWLCRHFSDFSLLSEHHGGPSKLADKLDAVVIDINLSRDAPDVLPPGDEFEAEEFHRRAGFYIYNELVLSGFPRERICFLTGEMGSTYDEFRGHCRVALMPLPRAYEKGDSGFGEFRTWLHNHRSNGYLTLRRGILDGCDELLARIKNNASCVRLRDFVPEAGADNEMAMATLSDNDLCEFASAHLSQLSQLLPARPPQGKELERQLSLLARSITHDWVALIPHELTKTNKAWFRDKEKRLEIANGKVLKLARNWLAHRTLTRFDVHDLAFLFLANTRAWFGLGPNTLPHEQLLLTLFAGMPRLDIPSINTKMETIYGLLGEEAQQHDHKANPYNLFDRIVSGTDWQPPSPGERINYVYMTYWFPLSEAGKKPWFVPSIDWLFEGNPGQFKRDFSDAICGCSFPAAPASS